MADYDGVHDESATAPARPARDTITPANHTIGSSVLVEGAGQVWPGDARLRRPSGYKPQALNRPIERSRARRVYYRGHRQESNGNRFGHDGCCRGEQREYGKRTHEYQMTDCGSSVPRQPSRDHRERCDDRRFRNQQQGDRLADGDHARSEETAS